MGEDCRREGEEGSCDEGDEACRREGEEGSGDEGDEACRREGEEGSCDEGDEACRREGEEGSGGAEEGNEVSWGIPTPAKVRPGPLVVVPAPMCGCLRTVVERGRAGGLSSGLV